MEIKCIIFDCDGLMFNTEYHSYCVWRSVMKKYGIVEPEGFLNSITGCGHHQFRQIMANYPEIDAIVPEIRASSRPSLIQYIKDHGNINKPGLTELLCWLKKQNYKVCVASSSAIDYVEWMLSTIGIEFEFDAVVGGDQVKEAKPNPAVFLKAAELAKIDPESCLVLEDSKNGHLAAKAAGMHRCFIQDQVIPDDEMKNELIEFECSNLQEVIELLENNR